MVLRILQTKKNGLLGSFCTSQVTLETVKTGILISKVIISSGRHLLKKNQGSSVEGNIRRHTVLKLFST